MTWKAEWPRYRIWEALATLALASQAASAAFLYPVPERNWRGGILFDEAVRDSLRVRRKSAREGVRTVSDSIYIGLALYPFLIDNLVVTWGVHGSPDVAGQMFGINLGAYFLTGALSLTSQKLGRERPAARQCASDPDYSAKCGSEATLTQSFFSGHTGINFTAAGLTCAHHEHLELYGGGVADRAACALALVAASAQGVTRIMTDDHYASDVLVGAGIGWISGYVLPTLLHYGAGSGSEPGDAGSGARLGRSRAGERVDGFRAALVPALSPEQVGIMLLGSY